MPQATTPSTVPVSSTVPVLVDTVDDSELMGDDLDSLLDCVPNDQEPPEVKSVFVLFVLADRYANSFH